MKVALDTNILAYAAGFDDGDRRDRALGVMARFGPDKIVVLTQVAGELYNVAVRKKGLARGDAAALIGSLDEQFGLAAPTASVFREAVQLAATQPLQIWDALIVCGAAELGCDLLLSEDMSDGLRYGGLTVVNPFAADPHPSLHDHLEPRS